MKVKNRGKTEDRLTSELTGLQQRWTEPRTLETPSDQSAEELQESVRRFRDIAENALEWIWEVDVDGKYTYASPSVETILGYKPEEMLKKHFYDLFHPEDRERLKKAAFEGFARRKPFRKFVNRNVHKDGKTVCLLTSGVPILDEKGNFVGYRGMDTDITELKQMEEALRESEERFRRFACAVTDVIYRYDPTNDRYDFISPSFEMQTGYSLDEIKADPSGMAGVITHPEDVDEVFKKVDDRIKLGPGFGPFCIEYRVIRKDGKVIWVSDRKDIEFAPDGNIYRINGIVRDITGRKQTEEALRKSEGRYRSIVENTEDVIMLTQPDGIISYISPACEKVLGYAQDDLAGKQPWIIHPDDIERVRETHAEALKGKGGSDLEYRIKTKEGKTKWISHSWSSIFTGGELEMIVSVVRDITEHKHAEQKLRKSELEKAAILDGITELVNFLDTQKKILWANKAAGESAGLPAEELKGKHCYEIWGQRDGPCEGCPVQKALETGQFQEGEVVTPDGRVWLVKGHPVKDDKGNAVGVVELTLDITKRKRVERVQSVLYGIADAVNTTKDIDELFKSIRKQLTTVLDTTNFYIALYDRENHTISLPYMVDEKDRFPSFPAGRTLTAYVIKEDKPLLATKETIEELARTGEVEIVGTLSAVWLGVPLKIRNEIIGVVAVQSYADASAYGEEDLEILKFVSGQIASAIERKKTDEALRESEEKFRDLLENANDLVQSVDAAGGFVYVNRKWLEIMGYSKDEVEGLELVDILREDKIPQYKKILRRVHNGESFDKLESVFTTKDGREIHVEGTVNGNFKNGTFTATRSIFRDITERKKVEEALRESEERYRTLIENQAEGIGIVDTREQFLFANPAADDIFGVPRGGLVDRNMKEFTGEKDFSIIHAHAELRRLGKKTTYDIEIIRPDGEKRILLVTATSRFDKEGRYTGAFGVFRDVTEHKRAEMERINLETRLSAIHDFSKRISTLLSVEDVLDVTLNMIEKVLGYEHCAIHFVDRKKNALHNKIHRGYSEKLMKSLNLLLDGREGITAWVAREGEATTVPDVREDPRYVPGMDGTRSEMAVPLKVGNEILGVIDVESPEVNAFSEDDLTTLSALASYVAIAIKNSLLFRDLAEAKTELEEWSIQLERKVRERTHELQEAQDQVLRSERLATIGQLSASIGHELRNPLGVLSNSLYFLNLKLKDGDEKVRKHLATMKREMTRSTKIISDLLDFSRNRESSFGISDLNQMIEEVFSRVSIPEGVEVRKDMGDIPTTVADATKLQSILLNLISNGIEAMPEGGILRVKTSRNGKYVEAEISDTGVGMSKENLGKIFEPLFTTKSKGIGLGLCVTKRFIENHGGTIEVESRLNAGSTFRIRFPIEGKKTS